jgi:hypothetical protein
VDFERERDRADRLMSEVLKATAETMVAKEAAARFEGELGPAIAALVETAGRVEPCAHVQVSHLPDWPSRHTYPRESAAPPPRNPAAP